MDQMIDVFNAGSFTFGGDPERFIKRNGIIVCPNDIIPIPKRVIPCGKYGGMNRDGMALELNPSPGSIKNVALNLDLLLTDAIYEAAQVGAELSDSIKTVIESFDELPPDVVEIGCEPDRNAYTEKENELTQEQLTMKERFAGGHIHVGMGYWASFHSEIVKAFDSTAGIMSVMWSVPESLERRRQYGRAGSYRVDQERGIIEYRVPDAMWTFKKGRFEALCGAMVKAFGYIYLANQWGAKAQFRPPLPQDEVIEVINNCDKKTAERMLKSLRLEAIA
jgi:hypothetical protein